MSLFPEYYETGEVYGWDDSDNTKVTIRNSTKLFDIEINVIRRDATDELVLGQELGEYVANIKGANASNVSEGHLINVDSGDWFQVVNKPRRNKLFNRYKVNLKPTDGRPNNF